MKTKSVRRVLPLFAFMAAVAGAFAFGQGESKVLAPEMGWINLPGQPCAVEVQCDNRSTGPLCTAIYQGTSHQAFGKSDPSVNICDKVLRMPLQNQ